MSRQVEIDGEVMDLDQDNFEPGTFAPWYSQLMKFDRKKRKQIVETALKRLRDSRPETYAFIKQSRCRLVGLCPAIDYTLISKDQGEIDVTFSHAFSMPTLLYWHPRGKFAFIVNANLEYDDTVLNKVRGNKVESIKGFTG